MSRKPLSEEEVQRIEREANQGVHDAAKQREAEAAWLKLARELVAWYERVSK